MRAIQWVVLGTILTWTSVVHAKVELITPPLSGDNLICSVLQVSDHPRQVTLEVLNSHGQFVAGFTDPALPPLTIATTLGFQNGGDYMCRLISNDGQRGEFRVTFCTVASGVCHAVVTAQ